MPAISGAVPACELGGVLGAVAIMRGRTSTKRHEEAEAGTCLRLGTLATIATGGHRTMTLDQVNGGGNMATPRAADDFQAIRARMEELRREREGSNATGADRGSVQPARRDSSDLLAISFQKGYRSAYTE